MQIAEEAKGDKLATCSPPLLDSPPRRHVESLAQPPAALVRSIVGQLPPPLEAASPQNQNLQRHGLSFTALTPSPVSTTAPKEAFLADSTVMQMLGEQQDDAFAHEIKQRLQAVCCATLDKVKQYKAQLAQCRDQTQTLSRQLDESRRECQQLAAKLDEAKRQGQQQLDDARREGQQRLARQLDESKRQAQQHIQDLSRQLDEAKRLHQDRAQRVQQLEQQLAQAERPRVQFAADTYQAEMSKMQQCIYELKKQLADQTDHKEKEKKAWKRHLTSEVQKMKDAERKKAQEAQAALEAKLRECQERCRQHKVMSEARLRATQVQSALIAQLEQTKGLQGATQANS